MMKEDLGEMTTLNEGSRMAYMIDVGGSRSSLLVVLVTMWASQGGGSLYLTKVV